MERNQTFDSAEALYTRFRPAYCPELYAAIGAYLENGTGSRPLDGHSRLIEIGIGTGQATLPFLETGAEITAVEYGENLARRCRERFAAFPNLRVLTGKFEDCPLEPSSAELVYSATAFHWIPEREGYEKVFSILKPGGVFARFANRPYTGHGELGEALQEVYRRFASCRGGVYKKPTEFSEERAEELAQLAGKYGFTDLRHFLFRSERTMCAADYVGLLGTYSDTIAMAPDDRSRFLAAIRSVIERHGGSITIRDTQDLELARKPV